MHAAPGAAQAFPKEWSSAVFRPQAQFVDFSCRCQWHVRQPKHAIGPPPARDLSFQRVEERFVAENPAILISGAPKPGGQGWSFAWCTFDRTSYIKREDTQDYYGTTQWLWGIIAGVYMALMGPHGLAEVGETISQRAAYLRRLISAIDGVTVMAPETPCFKEFAIRFDHSAVTVAEVNDRLRVQGIFGGKDLSGEFPELGQSALCCVTEQHNKKDLDRFVQALSEVIR